MKKALNNPLVVGVLVVLALAFVLRDFIHLSSLMKSGPSHSPAVVNAPPSTQTAALPIATPQSNKPATTTVKKLAHTDWDAVAKTPLSTRDPFSPRKVAPTRYRPPTTVADEEITLPQPPAMRLRAIVSAADTHYASINGQLLEIGSQIDGWKLVAIGVHRVQLRGEQGLLTLDIDGGARMGGRTLRTIKKKASPRTRGTPAPSAMAEPVRTDTIPNSVGDLNMYQGLFDSLMKQGILPSILEIK